MKKFATLCLALLLIILFSTFLTRSTVQQMNQNRKHKTHSNTSTTSDATPTLNSDTTDADISDVSDVTEEQNDTKDTIALLSATLPNYYNEDFYNYLCENYSDATNAVIQEIQSNTYKDSIWYYMTGMSLHVLYDTYQGILTDTKKAKKNHIYQKECASAKEVSLSFAGDVSFANDYLPAQHYSSQGINGAFSKDTQTTMKDNDIFMLNNEFCYSQRGTPAAGKTYTFRANPATVSRLSEMGVDIVSIANNHAMDYGTDAFVDTLSTLQNANMPYVGGGKNLKDAKKPSYFIANGIKIGYISATAIENPPTYSKEATKTTPGLVRCESSDTVVSMIKTAKKNCDYIVVYPHWGIEYDTAFNQAQQTLAHTFIDAGANVVIGGHTHCLQGVEYYKNTPIFYSLSNFSFSGKTINSTILNLKLTIDGIQSAQYIPCMEQGGKTSQCEKNDTNYSNIISLLNSVSKNASIDNNGMVSKK